MKKMACLKPEEIEAKLKEAGVQPTLQRLALCRFVLCEADHPTAEEVKQWAEKNLEKISLATVYNTLNTLVDAGLLKAFRLPHSDKVIYDHNIDEHFHFLDEKTGQLVDIAAGDLSYEIKLPKKYKVKGLEVVFKGEIK
jgi:Fur family transcriptional regulator, iron response regulator